ncbi:MAG: hypothetical protein ABSG68_14980 [Thermoguttaceae bacterium]
MKQFSLAVLLGSFFLSLAPASEEIRATNGGSATPTVTREFLLASGFKQSATDPDVFKAVNVRLGDVSRKLGFPLSSLRRTVNQGPESDVRTVVVRDRVFVVRSEVRDARGCIVDGSLSSPDALCTVSASLKPSSVHKPFKPNLPTDGAPRLRIKSVVVPQDRKKPLEIAFQLATDGKTPLAVSTTQLTIRLLKGDACVFEGRASFSEKATRAVLVQPGKPGLFTITALENSITDGLWSDHAPGKYVLRVVVFGAARLKPPRYDYQWLGGVPVPYERCSDDYTIEIKQDARR